jgi:beta-lactamase class A
MYLQNGGSYLRRRTGYIAWLIIIVAIAALFLTWQYLGFRASNRTLPDGMTMAGLSVEGMTREQALNALEVAFATPMEVMYQEQELSLAPDSIELRYNAEETAANMNAALDGREGMDGFIAHILRRSLDPIDVPVAVDFSPERLDGFLSRVARQYDQSPQEPITLPASLTVRAAQPGYELDVEASRARLVAALTSATDQHVELVVRVEEAPPLDPDVLAQLIQYLLDDHAGVVSGVFVKDLQTGDEVGINANVAYAGPGTLRIAILEETYRTLDPPLDPDVTDWLSDTMGADTDNLKANLLLRDIIGNGDSYQGAENLTTAMHHLGLVNTFMAAPYDEDVALTIVTPANTGADTITQPDAYIQTTPLDIGLLLEMIYQCSHGGGALMAAYPGDFTTDECNQMIEWMNKNRIDSLTEAGVPVGTRVAHRHGFTGDTHADAALVFSPGGDFVLVVFLYQPEWLEWEESAPLIADIATATYNYFNPVQ